MLRHMVKKIEQEHDILLIRHGRSIFNEREHEYLSKTDATYPEVEKDPIFLKEVLFSPRHIDTPLSQTGRHQCFVLREELMSQKIDIVLVSPLRRTLETAIQVFGKRKIPIKVQPELAETIRYCCNLADRQQVIRQKYPQVDFTNMDTRLHWYVEKLSERTVKPFLEWRKKNKGAKFQHEQEILLELLKKRVIYESDAELEQRVVRIKNMLAKYKEKYNKIAVVSHYHTLQGILTPVGQPLKNIPVKNARPYWVPLTRLLARR